MLNALGEPSIPKSYRKAVNDSPRTQNASRWCDDSRKLHSKTKQKWSRATLKDCSPLSPTASQPPTAVRLLGRNHPNRSTTRARGALPITIRRPLPPVSQQCAYAPSDECASTVFLCISVFSPGCFLFAFRVSRELMTMSYFCWLTHRPVA